MCEQEQEQEQQHANDVSANGTTPPPSQSRVCAAFNAHTQAHLRCERGHVVALELWTLNLKLKHILLRPARVLPVRGRVKIGSVQALRSPHHTHAAPHPHRCCAASRVACLSEPGGAAIVDRNVWAAASGVPKLSSLNPS